MLNPVRKSSSSMNSRGFSLIELMLAMLIGIIIIGGVMSLYISTRNTQRVSKDQLQMIADARFVIETISYDLRHAGYWGEADFSQSIRCRLDDPLCTGADMLVTATGDCETRWYIDLNRPMVASDNLTNWAASCTANGYLAGTDVLGVHFADSNTVESLTPVNLLAAGVVFLRSNYQAGGLFIGTAIPTTGPYDLPLWPNIAENNSRTKNRRLMSNVYYVSSYTSTPGGGNPSLRRVELKAGPVMEDSVLIPNVVDLQFEYGVDTDDPLDDSANSYVSANNIPLDNTGAPAWARVRSVKIWVLLRAERKDRDGVAGAQTFTLANNPPVTYNDGFRYYMASSIVKLRNSLEIDVQ
jgi:type IV pilus assembly protein PilW